MPTYIALLRAVNIGGNTLKMERLRKVCTQLGLAGVRTYVQSGNVVFESDQSAKACGEAIEKALLGETRLPVSVIIRTPAELKRVLNKNPFPSAFPCKPAAQGTRTKPEPARLYVAFLAATPTRAALENLEGITVGEDQFHVSGREIYLHYANGYGNSKLSNNLFEKLLSLRATTRNWNTVNKLHEMTMESCDF